MKTLTSCLIVSLVLCAGAAVSPAAEPPPRVNETVSGWSFRAIEAAVTELKRHGLNVDDYQIFVVRHGSLLAVLFRDPADAPNLSKIGCVGPRECLTVQLAVEDFRIIRSDYGAQNR
jgi:hypothetical protein